MLADSLRAGKTHLLIEPSADLLNLDDPYDYQSRETVEFLWDASLYEGKYYLYWGPTPALITILLEMLLPVQVGDQLLGWLLSMLMLGIVLTTIGYLWNRYLSSTPKWIFMMSVITIAFANPLPWIMTRPAVYEVAITSGQLFFWGGFLLLLHHQLEGRGLAWKVILAGVFWVLAVGSRATLAVSVILGTGLFVSLEVFKNGWTERLSWIEIFRLGYLLLPLMIGAGILAWYNYVRFGSFFEFGHRYQLSSLDMTKNYKEFFSISNILPNTFNYLLNPFRRVAVFPFIKPEWGKYSVPFLRASASQIYQAEKITGLLLSSPFLLFTLAPFILISRQLWENLDTFKQYWIDLKTVFDNEIFRIYFVLLFIGIAQLLPLLPISVISLRYSADFAYSGFILAAFGLGYSWLSTGRSRLLITALAVVLSLCSIVASILLAFTGYYAVFEKLNPQLFDAITRFFTL
jgi:hypothetical protein